jgi:hypothetical protein
MGNKGIVRFGQFGNGPLPNWILNTRPYIGTFYPGDETYPRAQMTESLALIPSAVKSQLNRNAGFRELREMVLNSVVSEHSKRNYAKSLDEVYTLCEERNSHSRALLMEYRAAMPENLRIFFFPSTCSPSITPMSRASTAQPGNAGSSIRTSTSSCGFLKAFR